jgi:hypothetical protein
MDGDKCKMESYKGYFAEFSYGFGGAVLGADAGMSENQYYLPNGFSGVNEAGVGAGTPGGSAAVCYYFYVGERATYQ